MVKNSGFTQKVKTNLTMNLILNRIYSKKQYLFNIIVLLNAMTVIAMAQDVQRVKIQVNTTWSCKGSKPTEEDVSAAVLAGKREIVKCYLEQASPARQQLLAEVREKLVNNLDLVISDYKIVTQEFDKKAKELSLSQIAYVIEKDVESLIPRSTGKGNYISLIFVARRQATVKSFNPESITGNSTITSNSKIASQESSGAENTVSVSTTKENAEITRAATIKSSDRIKYEMATCNQMETAIEGVLVERNFKVVPSATIRKKSNGAFAEEKFLDSFKNGQDIDPEQIQSAAEACKSMNPKLPFYGYGTLTLEPPQRDGISGRIRVNVQIYAKVIDCREDFAITAASIESIQYSAFGESATEAETVALTGAAKMAAKLIADKLNAKGIY